MRNPLVAVAAAIFCLAGVNSAPAQIWKVANIAPNLWTSVAASADGTRLAAVADNGPIFTSTDAGATWITNNATGSNWISVASSADGTKLVAVTINGGIYTNSGINWALSQNSGLGTRWDCVASSASGSNLVAAGAGLLHGAVSFSTNAGVSWVNGTAPYSPLQSVASTGDGTNLFGANGAVYTSSNAGAGWSALNNSPPINYIVCSTNGLNLAGLSTSNTNSIYTSANAGSSWATNTLTTTALTSLACSADGTKLVVAASGGGIFHSPDAGAHWMQGDAGGLPWTAVASSADGTKLVATAPGYIFIGMTPLPVLTMAPAGTNVSISWTTNVAGYSLFLFAGTNVTRQASFFAPLPVITNNLYRVTLPATNSQLFFWLAPAD